MCAQCKSRERRLRVLTWLFGAIAAVVGGLSLAAITGLWQTLHAGLKALAVFGACIAICSAIVAAIYKEMRGSEFVDPAKKVFGAKEMLDVCAHLSRQKNNEK